jgi:FtsZ-interacting cell division protein ZipA
MVLTELQISLIGLGAVGIVAVWAYNKWQEHRHRKAAERVFRGEQADVLLDKDNDSLDKGRVEPRTVEQEPINRRPTEKQDAARVEPALATSEQRQAVSPEKPPAKPLQEPPEEVLDAVIDAVVRLELTDPIPAQRIRDVQRTLAGRLSKPLRWVGLDEESQWCEIGARDVASYQCLRAGLLLANRAGALSETELQDYLQGMQELATRLAATIELPDADEALSRAVALDEACASVDIQIAVHIVHRDALPMKGAQLLAFAKAAGLDLREDGLFYGCDAGGAVQFTMTNLGSLPFVAAELDSLSTHGITFWLDVPRVANAAVVFDRMIAVTRQMAASLNGVMVDDQRSPLSDAMLLDIRGKIVEIQQNLSGLGIAPGSTRALRLFA